MAKLTATKIKEFPYKGRYGDGDGLFLNVTATGTKSWVQRVVVHGRRRDIGLGGYPAVSLAEARQRCTDNRKAIAAGLDPIAEKRKPTVATFREAAETVHEMNIPRWRSGKHAKSWLRMLERYAFPVIGDTPVDRVDRTDVLAILKPIWTTKPETARRVRQRMRMVFRWAMSHGLIDHNPAGEVIDGALPTMPHVREHFRSLPYQGGGSSAQDRRGVRSVHVREALSPVPRLDSGPFGGGQGCHLGRNRPGGPDVADTGITHEGGCRASSTSQRVGTCSVGSGIPVARRIRLGVPVTAEAWPGA